jgi:hypothetical protein
MRRRAHCLGRLWRLHVWRGDAWHVHSTLGSAFQELGLGMEASLMHYFFLSLFLNSEATSF